MENLFWIASADVLPVLAGTSIPVDTVNLQQKAHIPIRHVASATIVISLRVEGALATDRRVGEVEVRRESVTVVILDQLAVWTGCLWLDDQTIGTTVWLYDLAFVAACPHRSYAGLMKSFPKNGKHLGHLRVNFAHGTFLVDVIPRACIAVMRVAMKFDKASVPVTVDTGV
jgi:hypothetical protein